MSKEVPRIKKTRREAAKVAQLRMCSELLGAVFPQDCPEGAEAWGRLAEFLAVSLTRSYARQRGFLTLCRIIAEDGGQPLIRLEPSPPRVLKSSLGAFRPRPWVGAWRGE